MEKLPLVTRVGTARIMEHVLKRALQLRAFAHPTLRRADQVV
jgi:hypothetical protein